MDALLDRPPIEVLPLGERPQPRTNEITEWCPTCLERVVAMRNGSCGWCDTPLEEGAEPDTSTLVPEPSFQVSKVETEVEGGGLGDVVPSSESDPAPVRVPRRRDRRHRHGKPYSDEQIIARISLWAKLTGEPPTKADWTPAKLRSRATAAREAIECKLRLIALYELGDFPSETTVRERFGSLNAALELAGFEPRATGRPPRPDNDAAMRAAPKPKAGEKALRGYFDKVAELREQWGEGPALKAALYDLALSAIAEADRIIGYSDELV